MATSQPAGFDRNIFINCPFDDDYLPLLQPLLFTIIYFDYNPRIASESADSGEQRIDKICDLIDRSKYSIHDLSRLRSKTKKEFYRLNMPFELGIDYGCRRFATNHHRDKKFLILEKNRYDYAKALSDLSGVDIKTHEEKPGKIVRATRNWITTLASETIDSSSVVWEQFNLFIEDFYEKRKAENFSDDDIYEMPVSEFIGYIRKWIK